MPENYLDIRAVKREIDDVRYMFLQLIQTNCWSANHTVYNQAIFNIFPISTVFYGT
jgi:hypothetical protein